MKIYIKTILKYTVIGFIISLILFVFLETSGKNPLLVNSRIPFDLLLLPALIFLMLYEIKRVIQDNEISFRIGLFHGSLLYIFLTLLFGVFVSFYLNQFGENIIDDFITLSIENISQNKEKAIKELGQSEAQIEATISNIKSLSIQDIVFDFSIRKLGIGFISTLIISMFMRTKGNNILNSK